MLNPIPSQRRVFSESSLRRIISWPFPGLTLSLMDLVVVYITWTARKIPDWLIDSMDALRSSVLGLSSGFTQLHQSTTPNRTEYAIPFADSLNLTYRSAIKATPIDWLVNWSIKTSNVCVVWQFIRLPIRFLFYLRGLLDPPVYVAKRQLLMSCLFIQVKRS